jgi:hypothetical protein
MDQGTFKEIYYQYFKGDTFAKSVTFEISGQNKNVGYLSVYCYFNLAEAKT